MIRISILYPIIEGKPAKYLGIFFNKNIYIYLHYRCLIANPSGSNAWMEQSEIGQVRQGSHRGMVRVEYGIHGVPYHTILGIP